MNTDVLSSDAPACRPRPAAGANAIGGDAGIAQTADLLVRDRDKAVCWLGPADDSAAPLADLALLTAELARRGLKATLTVEPLGDRLAAHVAVT